MPYPNGANTLGEFVTSLPEWVKILTVLLVIGAGVAGVLELPEMRGQVEANTDSVRALSRYNRVQDLRFDRHQEATNARLQRILCHLEEQRESNPTWERCEQ
ncbi:MAG: hypothetical protein GWN53_17330 [Gammaproteobacteria bacterium]|uniref:Uncharacterized protein n=1 Tax=Candidatus Kutchimonas denitrificans TaxID=3056748 RepID=A0AAE4ZC62_9BACT|nr:hypothetical protein [Candidatus Kutchimonas denitrificans]NIV53605.1 hypothetical protein [Gammaproteobacteria bacterium]